MAQFVCSVSCEIYSYLVLVASWRFNKHFTTEVTKVAMIPTFHFISISHGTDELFSIYRNFSESTKKKTLMNVIKLVQRYLTN